MMYFDPGRKVVTPPIDPGVSPRLAVRALSSTASCRQLLDAERRRGDRLSAWISALAFLVLSATLDLARLLRGAA